jgi:hypothetical protein
MLRAHSSHQPNHNKCGDLVIQPEPLEETTSKQKQNFLLKGNIELGLIQLLQIASRRD